MRKRLHLSGRFWRWHGALILSFLLALLLAIPILAEYLGPNRHTVELVRVRDPDNDVWTLTNINPPVACPTVYTCLLIHTCQEHPSVEQATYWCCDGTLTRKWVATSSSCDKAYRWEEKEVDLPEATIDGVIANCTLVNGWCTTSPSLQLHGAEPLEGEVITGIEGARNGEAFFCPGDTCDVPLVEGQNSFSYWALSSYGDSSRMGEEADLVDTLSPSLSGEVSGVAGENGWLVSQATLSASASDPSPGSGLAAFEVSVDGAGWVDYTVAIVLDEAQHLVQLRSEDNAGHVTEITQTILVDTHPPQSVFTNPSEGSEIWIAGILDLAGASADATSGLAMAEISHDGGGIW